MFEFIAIQPENAEEGNSTTLPQFERLEIKNFSFRFPGRKQLLQEISLELKKGEMVALLGESGGGKSTLIQILQKFYRQELDHILVNGRELSSINTVDWRNTVGVVPQEIKIFNGNVLYNITLSEHLKEFEEAVEFCKLYGFEKFFTDFPHGYSTILGEGGVNISGGQKQLLGFARALFKKPKLLLLDEATSSMDKDVRNFILTMLCHIRSEIGILLVTHQMSLANECDRLYILEGGKIQLSVDIPDHVDPPLPAH